MDGGAPSLSMKYSVVVALITTIGSFTIGFAFGFTSSVLLDLAELSGDGAFRKASTESELFGALLPAGAVVGSPLGGIVAQRIGRKAALQVGAVPSLIGWVLIFVAQYTTNTSTFKSFLLLGRALTGVATGMQSTVIPMYIAEMSPPKKRGFLGTFHLILKMLGLFMSYVMGAIPGLLYYHSALFMAVVLLLSELLIIFLRESPRWLLMKNHKYAAKKSLFWLFRSQTAVEKLVELIEASLSQTRLALRDKLKMFKESHVYIPLLLSVAISFFHQFTGSNVIISYAAQLFLTAGVENAEETAIYAIGVLQIIGVVVSALVIDLVGRKKLLMFGSIGVAISNLVLGTHLYITRESQCGFIQNVSNLTFGNLSYSGDDSQQCYSSLGGLAITSVITFSFFYAVGWRSLPYIMMGEMYPNSVRGILGGIGAMVLFTFASIVIGGYPAYEEAVRPYTAWWSFAGVAALSIPFILILPETKGKSLEEIEEHFKRKKRTKQEDSTELVQARHDSIVSTLSSISVTIPERRDSVLSKETSV